MLIVSSSKIKTTALFKNNKLIHYFKNHTAVHTILILNWDLTPINSCIK